MGHGLFRFGELQQRLSERPAHQREGLRAAEVVVAGVRCAALPERGFGRGDEFGLELLQILSLFSGM